MLKVSKSRLHRFPLPRPRTIPRAFPGLNSLPTPIHTLALTISFRSLLSRKLKPSLSLTSKRINALLFKLHRPASSRSITTTDKKLLSHLRTTALRKTPPLLTHRTPSRSKAVRSTFRPGSATRPGRLRSATPFRFSIRKTRQPAMRRATSRSRRRYRTMRTSAKKVGEEEPKRGSILRSNRPLNLLSPSSRNRPVLNLYLVNSNPKEPVSSRRLRAQPSHFRPLKRLRSLHSLNLKDLSLLPLTRIKDVADIPEHQLSRLLLRLLPMFTLTTSSTNNKASLPPVRSKASPLPHLTLLRSLKLAFNHVPAPRLRLRPFDLRLLHRSTIRP